MLLMAKPIQQLYCFSFSPNHNSLFSKISTTTNSPTQIRCCFASSVNSAPPVLKKRNRYRKMYPGESTGITEEMRFVAMKLRNTKAQDRGEGEGGDSDTWQPSMEGFISYLVDSKLVFDTVERIVDESENVSYAYFRKTGLERSEGLSKDLEGFKEQGVVIPNPSSPGLSYAEYLEELGERSAPLFLSHFYNIYFSHISGGQVIAKQVSKSLLEGKELEFYKWEGEVTELLKGVRENLNMLSEVDY
ncbi:hypothetical protein TanjilG_08234 [Lupinus angustifolius]|uniref:Heme oxygenase 1 n=1 Tax=Lupinus angustifolius TaxID=3871 RepID=A0A394DAU5_LUPAN|nr:hypothetical protein TanjilG_08234 [Lupinus angustifolius]